MSLQFDWILGSQITTAYIEQFLEFKIFFLFSVKFYSQ